MLHFTVVPIKSPVSSTIKYYPRLAPCTPITLDQLCEDIANESTVTRHDIKGVLSALQEQVFKHLRNGKSVRLGDLGSFHPTLGSIGVDTEPEMTAAKITSVRVRFTPSSKIRFELSPKNPAVVLGVAGIEPVPEKKME